MRWYFLFESIFMLCAPFEIGYVWIYKSTVTDGFISSVLNTNISEASELLMTIKWQCLILLLLWTGYYFIVFRKIKNNYLFTRKYSFIAGVSVIALNLTFFFTTYATEYRLEKSHANINEVTDNFIDNYRSAYPCNIIATLVRKYENHMILKNMHKNIASFSYHAKQNSILPEREIYIVIIGESARYGNFSINGYKRHTSPQLEKIKDFMTYSDVYTTSTVTEFALPLLLSSATPLNPDDAFKEKTFADAFKECGFYTGWIANQSGYHPYIKRIAKDIDKAFFISDESDNPENYDGLLLPYIDSLLNKNEQKTFIVIHTLGSHFRYNFRYPKPFERYIPALEGTANYSITSDKDKELIINAYDNSIFYTDFILSEIINRVASQQCISTVLYISDHAENLYDNGSLSVFHGSKNPPKAEVHIPLFIWTSPDYNRAYPHKQKALKANINKKISASNLFYSVLDIADLSYPGEKPEKSIASDSFVEDSIRYVYTANKEVIHFQ
ncbi:MAG: lipid A phosphoethanolamine transferase [Tannerella sp.]|nr:lipid A phosphoethanolamine transferase [Tannerella sp.]